MSLRAVSRNTLTSLHRTTQRHSYARKLYRSAVRRLRQEIQFFSGPFPPHLKPVPVGPRIEVPEKIVEQPGSRSFTASISNKGFQGPDLRGPISRQNEHLYFSEYRRAFRAVNNKRKFSLRFGVGVGMVLVSSVCAIFALKMLGVVILTAAAGLFYKMLREYKRNKEKLNTVGARLADYYVENYFRKGKKPPLDDLARKDAAAALALMLLIQSTIEKRAAELQKTQGVLLKIFEKLEKLKKLNEELHVKIRTGEINGREFYREMLKLLRDFVELKPSLGEELSPWIEIFQICEGFYGKGDISLQEKKRFFELLSKLDPETAAEAMSLFKD